MSVAAGVAARNCDARLRRYWRLKKSSRPITLLPRRKLTLHYAYASNSKRLIETAAALRRLLLPRLGPAPPIARVKFALGLASAKLSDPAGIVIKTQNTAIGCEIAPFLHAATSWSATRCPDKSNCSEGFDSPCLFARVPVSLGDPLDSRTIMRLSHYLLPILRETPKEAEVISHRLMLRAGLIRQEAAGIYAWLPLGFRVLKKIEQIVREEQDRAGAIELLMPTLQLADLWRESGRYDAYGPEMLRIKDRHERDMLYGPTNEDMITEIFRAYIRSYRELPKILYHIQWKFRDEQRPRFGVMRGREFLMKDAYSFDIDEAA